MVPEIYDIFNSIPVDDPIAATGNLGLDFANFGATAAAPQIFDDLDPCFNATNVPLLPLSSSSNGNGFASPVQNPSVSAAQVMDGF